ncbi:hypothetical protein IUU84_06395 [Kocuria rhizophila]|nr:MULTISPECIES: hypothetical protein [Kocuria]MDV5999206.1 hypothetical protein [Kocuria rhizophila]
MGANHATVKKTTLMTAPQVPASQPSRSVRIEHSHVLTATGNSRRSH